MCAPRPPPPGCRRPQGTLLHQVVETRLADFLQYRAQAGRPVPAFVVRDFNLYLRCGDISWGYATLFCADCGFDHDVAFSCKRRGYCTHCLVRRMLDRAAFLQDAVFGDVPVRHWIQCLPPPLRNLVAYNARLTSAILTAHMKSVFRYYRRKAKKLLNLRSMQQAIPAALTSIQRASANAVVNLHYHTLTPDGVYVLESPDGPVTFHHLPPTPAEVAAVADDTCRRVVRLLRRRGMWTDLPGKPDDPPGTLTGRIALGKVRRRVRFFAVASRQENDRPVKRNGAVAFDLCATQHVRRGDRKKLLRLLRYVLSPPLTDRQLSLRADGDIDIAFKRPRNDGTSVRVVSQFKLLGILVALTPRPRLNLVRFHGGFAANAALRDLIVPRPVPCQPPPSADDDASAEDRRAWAELLKRVHPVEATRCPRCAGRLQLIALKSDRLTYRRCRDDPRWSRNRADRHSAA